MSALVCHFHAGAFWNVCEAGITHAPPVQLEALQTRAHRVLELSGSNLSVRSALNQGFNVVGTFRRSCANHAESMLRTGGFLRACTCSRNDIDGCSEHESIHIELNMKLLRGIKIDIYNLMCTLPAPKPRSAPTLGPMDSGAVLLQRAVLLWPAWEFAPCTQVVTWVCLGTEFRPLGLVAGCDFLRGHVAMWMFFMVMIKPHSSSDMISNVLKI